MVYKDVCQQCQVTHAAKQANIKDDIGEIKADVKELLKWRREP